MDRAALLVTDDLLTGQIGSLLLRELGLDVTVAGSRKEAMEHLRDRGFDLYVIYTNEPKKEWLDFCRQARAQVANPILMAVVWGSESAALEAYRAGVDDFIMMPFSAGLFLAKAHAWLRRSSAVPAPMVDDVRAGPYQLDSERREFMRGGRPPVKLTNLEFKVLSLLMSHLGRPLSPDYIVQRAWGEDDTGDPGSLKNVIYRLRRKLKAGFGDKDLVQTVPGEGYVFRAPPH
ncbi:MAG: response regulator transcription factor [Rudaea sp.]